jgi:hypothetical protein
MELSGVKIRHKMWWVLSVRWNHISLATSFNCEFIKLRTNLYRRSQNLSREAAQIRENADCF